MPRALQTNVITLIVHFSSLIHVFYYSIYHILSSIEYDIESNSEVKEHTPEAYNSLTKFQNLMG